MLRHVVSFRHAFTGLSTALTTQPYLKFHFLAIILVTLAGTYFHISLLEGIIIILAIGLVVTTELVNTALEYLGDAVTLDQNAFIKNARDISASAVLISALAALTVGIFIFLPYLTSWL